MRAMTSNLASQNGSRAFVSVKFKMADYGGVRIPENEGYRKTEGLIRQVKA